MNRIPPQRKPLVRKHRWYPKPREREPFPEGLWDYIMARDKECIFRAFPDHRCQGRQTVEHVPDENRKGIGMRREIAAPNDKLHLVRACLDANVNGYASAHRDFARQHIARVEHD